MARLSSPLIIISASLLIMVLGYIDLITGNEMSFSIFYIIPIGYAAWRIGGMVGTALALLSAVAWLVADIMSGHVYSAGWLLFWNASVRFSIFIIVVYLLIRIKRQLRFEESLADQDPLTGLNNRRAFFEQCDMALARLNRYDEIVTLAYIDLDSFKLINDTKGHEEGDNLLVEVANCIRDNTRSSDIQARLGGDEFACLFPRAGWNEGEALVRKLHNELNELFDSHEWPVTSSLGALTIDQPAGSAKELINRVDMLMYSVKRSRKNAVLHKKWSEGTTGVFSSLTPP
jgi:diguanylate cyclase (GGDEF)-like protein